MGVSSWMRKDSCSHCLLTEHGPMTELQSITCSARRLNPARVTPRWTACQRLSAAAAVQSGVQWWAGGGPEAAVTSQTPLSGAWPCLCCSSLSSCQPFSQLCELPSSFSINSFFPIFFLLKFTIIFCYLMSRFLPQSVDVVGTSLRVTNMQETRAFVSNLQEAQI